MPTGRRFLAAVTSGGKIYAIGGERLSPSPDGGTQSHAVRTVEAYNPRTNTWMTATPLPAARTFLAATAGTDGRIYVLGGISRPYDIGDPRSGLATVEIYHPRSHHWSQGISMPDGRFGLAAVTGKDGRIYTIGGATRCEPSDLMDNLDAPRKAPLARSYLGAPGQCYGSRTVRAYDPRTHRWTQLPSLHVGRVLPAAAVGADGRIYVMGGFSTCLYCWGNPPSEASAEVYDPRTNRWTPTAPLNHPRFVSLAAARGRDGRIYVTGGCIAHITRAGLDANCRDPAPVDTYDPARNAWSTVGVTLKPRDGLAATTGPDGRVYAVGGCRVIDPARPFACHILEVIPPQR